MANIKLDMKFLKTIHAAIAYTFLVLPIGSHSQTSITEVSIDATDITLNFETFNHTSNQFTLQTKVSLNVANWSNANSATLTSLGNNRYRFIVPRSNADQQIFRVQFPRELLSAQLFDPERMPVIEVNMDPADWASLNKDSRFGSSSFKEIANFCEVPWPNEYTWFEASVTVDGVALDRVGIRRKGFIGSLFGDNPALKIKSDKFVKDQFFGDTERITLNNNAFDPTGLAACISYQVFTAAGHPAPRCSIADVWVNGDHLGNYTHIEAIKKRFLAHAFGDNDGSLYEGTFTDFVAEWLPRWEVKTTDTDPTRAPLLVLAEALQAPDEQLVEALEPVLNIERYITYWALEVILNHEDSYSRSRNNFFVYFDPTDDDRAVFIPWGIDNLPFLRESPLNSFLNAELPRRLSRNPEIADAMLSELDRLMTEVWNVDALLQSIDNFEALVEGAGGGSPSDKDKDGNGYVQSMRTWVQKRPDAIAELIANGMPASPDEMVPCLSDIGKGDGGGGKGDGGGGKGDGVPPPPKPAAAEQASAENQKPEDTKVEETAREEKPEVTEKPQTPQPAEKPVDPPAEAPNGEKPTEDSKADETREEEKVDGDFNEDGISDIVFQNAEGSLAVWYMNAADLDSAALLEPNNVGNLSFHIVGSGDFNGDTKEDLLFQHTDGTLAVWHINGSVPYSDNTAVSTSANGSLSDPRHPSQQFTRLFQREME